MLSGCVNYPGGIAPSTVPLGPGGYTVVKENVEGSGCRVALLGILPLSGGNKTCNAVVDALKEAPGATALVNVTSDAVLDPVEQHVHGGPRHRRHAELSAATTP